MLAMPQHPVWRYHLSARGLTFLAGIAPLTQLGPARWAKRSDDPPKEKRRKRFRDCRWPGAGGLSHGSGDSLAQLDLALEAVGEPLAHAQPCSRIAKDIMKESLSIYRAAGICVLMCALCVPASAGQSPVTPARPTPAPAVPGYVIGVDDILTVNFWRDNIAADVVVRPDGRISLPLLNDVQAAGYTPESLARALETAASKFITEPNVAVMVKEIRSRKAFVLGEVGAPGMIQLAANMNLLQAIAMAGGLLEHADKKNIIVIRTDSGKETHLKFNFNDIVDGKSVKQSTLLHPGDTIVVR
jgi:polysaccharide export outer membrane protein